MSYTKTEWKTGDIITADKMNKLEEGVSQLSNSIRDLPSGGEVTDEQVSNAVNSWLDEHPEATTTVQDGTITEAKLADDVKDKIDKASKSGGGSGYKHEYIGTPFPALDAYQAWAIAGVQYDKARDRIMCLVTDADQHVNATKYRLNLYSLNPVTSEVKLIKTLKDNTVDPVISISDAFGSQRGFLIDNDTGIYYKFHFGDGYVPVACKSEDGGETWTDIAITETNSTDILFAGGNGAVLKTSSGRIVCGLFGNGFAYTDDYFQTLTYYTSGKYAVDGVASAHEYELIEYATGKLVAIMRKTWQSRTGEIWSGEKRIEPPLLSFSDDNGATWTYPVESTSITNMSATNCAAFVHGDTLDLYVGCRYPVFADKVSAMFRYTANLADIPSDAFAFKETMFYGNTSECIDFGNLAGCIDSVGNYHLFYNDAKDGKVRWHYIKIVNASDNESKVKEIPVNKLTQTYTANAVDAFMDTVYRYIGEVRAELLLKIGELPERGDTENPTYWVSDGLVTMFDFAEENFNASTNAFKAVYGDTDADVLIYTDAADGTYNNKKVISTKDEIIDGFGTLVKTALIDSTDGYTIELDITSDPTDGGGSSPTYLIWSNPLLDVRNICIPEFNTTTARGKQTLGTYSFVAGEKGIFDATRAVNTFAWTFDRTNQRAYAYLNGVLVLDSNDLVVTDGFSLDIKNLSGVDDFKKWKQYDFTPFMSFASGAKSAFRLYDRPLTAGEIKANAKYSNG